MCVCVVVVVVVVVVVGGGGGGGILLESSSVHIPVMTDFIVIGVGVCHNRPVDIQLLPKWSLYKYCVLFMVNGAKTKNIVILVKMS